VFVDASERSGYLQVAFHFNLIRCFRWHRDCSVHQVQAGKWLWVGDEEVDALRLEAVLLDKLVDVEVLAIRRRGDLWSQPSGPALTAQLLTHHESISVITLGWRGAHVRYCDTPRFHVTTRWYVWYNPVYKVPASMRLQNVLISSCAAAIKPI
jgi:hypothetical protein